MAPLEFDTAVSTTDLATTDLATTDVSTIDISTIALFAIAPSATEADVAAAIAPVPPIDLADLEGSFTLTSGIFQSIWILEGGPVAWPSHDLAAAAGAAVLAGIRDLEATIPFSDGALQLDLATALGPIAGPIDFAGGDLNVDLQTPFGPLVFDWPFEPGTVIPFAVSVPLVGTVSGGIDLHSGNLVAALEFLGQTTIPLTALQGTVSLSDGIATVATRVPVAGFSLPVTTQVDLGPLASEYVVQFLQDLNAVGTVAGGQLTATADSPLGSFDPAVDLVALVDTLASGDGAPMPLPPIPDSPDLIGRDPTLSNPLAGLDPTLSNPLVGLDPTLANPLVGPRPF